MATIVAVASAHARESLHFLGLTSRRGKLVELDVGSVGPLDGEDFSGRPRLGLDTLASDVRR